MSKWIKTLGQFGAVISVSIGMMDISLASSHFYCGIGGQGYTYSTSGKACLGGKLQTVNPTDNIAICNYSAGCTIEDPTKDAQIEAAARSNRFIKNKTIKTMSDGEISATISYLIQSGSSMEVFPMSIQCFTTATKDAPPNCPDVNACVNKPDATFQWGENRYQPYGQWDAAMHSGYQIDSEETTAPVPNAPKNTH